MHGEAHHGPGGARRAVLESEFVALFSWIELALVYGLAAPIVLPLAATTAATHHVVTRWLLLHRQDGLRLGVASRSALSAVALPSSACACGPETAVCCG